MSSLVSTLMPSSRVPVQSQVKCRAQTQAMPLKTGILVLLTLQPDQSPAQGVAALLPTPFAVLLLGKNINHILGKEFPEPQRVTV